MKRESATLIFGAALTVFLSGCFCFLPPGEAPDGAIIHNLRDGARTEAEAENQLTTLLTAFMLTHPEYSEFRLESAPGDRERLRRIFTEAAATGGAEISDNARVTLAADFAGDVWNLEITGDGRVLWRENPTVISARPVR